MEQVHFIGAEFVLGGPELSTVGGLNQVDDHAPVVARFPHAPAKYVTGAQLRCYIPNSLIGDVRVRDHFYVGDIGEPGCQRHT